MDKKGGGPSGPSPFSFPGAARFGEHRCRHGLNPALYSPAVDPRQEYRKEECSAHATRAKGKRVVEFKKPNAEHSADDRGEPAQRQENGYVSWSFVQLDDPAHCEGDDRAHYDPDSDSDPVLHVSPARGIPFTVRHQIYFF